MSWIEHHEKMLNTTYEKEPIQIIKCFFTFVNNNNEIEKVVKEEVELFIDDVSNVSILTKDNLLEIIRKQKESFNNPKFIYRSLLSFNINLENDALENFLEDIDEDGTNNSDIPYDFLKEIPLIDSIIFEPCIYFFHSICSLYFIFQEIPKPILKLSKPQGHVSDNLKKRVTIKLNKPSNHNTRKNIS